MKSSSVVRGRLDFSDDEDEIVVGASESMRTEVVQIGRLTVENLLTVPEFELAALANVSIGEVRTAKRAALDGIDFKPMSMSELSTPLKRLSTGIPGLDRLLNGGLSYDGGEIIEIRGESGVGKTLLAMTIAKTSAQIHRRNVLLIDTCNNVNVERLRTIFSNGSDIGENMQLVTIVQILNISRFLDFIDSLEIAKDEVQYDLIIVDSFAQMVAPLVGKRNPVGNSVAETLINVLKRIATLKHCCVILSSFGVVWDDGSFRPSLGQWFSYAAHHVLELSFSPHRQGIVECRLAQTVSLPIVIGSGVELRLTTQGVTA